MSNPGNDATQVDEMDLLARKICDITARQKPVEQCTPDEVRSANEARGNSFAPEDCDLASIEDITIPTTAGTLTARIYRPHCQENTLRPALVYYHGGGFVLGSVDGHDTVAQNLACLSGYVVISVEYRLAPETKSADIFQDGLDSYNWVVDSAHSLGLDSARIAVGGDSAGGNLSIAVVLRYQQENHQMPESLVLFYPVTDWRMETDSMNKFAEGFFLTKAGMSWFRDHFLEEPSRCVDPLVSPVLQDDLTGMPPTLVITAGYDPLRDEGQAFADRLSQDGVSVQHTCYTDMIHGFVSFSGGLKQGMAAMKEAARFLKDLPQK